MTSTVTRADVGTWLATVARLDPLAPRAAEYVRQWNVVEKIARAKARGDWPPLECGTLPSRACAGCTRIAYPGPMSAPRAG